MDILAGKVYHQRTRHRIVTAPHLIVDDKPEQFHRANEFASTAVNANIHAPSTARTREFACGVAFQRPTNPKKWLART